ncbi:MAG: hypothetical protein OXR82_16965 [Gammaproteobacteria bacterium]|nr:hypothetical protein [Gammaproteobacteria bacterium]MDE0260064.1 hypothetical protein [Gammaproteobacteria bacterium]
MNWSAFEDIVMTLGLFAAVVGIVWLRARVNQARLARQAETQQQLLAKFQSGRELAEFIETDDGKQFLGQFESDPHRMMLVVLSAGVVSSVLGLGFLVLMIWEDGFLYPGVGTTALGVGLIAAAIISKKLSDQWRQ